MGFLVHRAAYRRRFRGASGLSCSGGTLVVAARFVGSTEGVDTYRRSALGWHEEGLVPGATGSSVALDGNVLVVGGGAQPLSIFRRATENGPFELEVGPLTSVITSAVRSERVARVRWTVGTGSQLDFLHRTPQGWVADSTVPSFNVGLPRDLDLSMDDARLAAAVALGTVTSDRSVYFFRDMGTHFEAENRLRMSPGTNTGGIVLDGDRLAVGDATERAIDVFERLGGTWHPAVGLRPYRAATLPVGLRFKALRWSGHDLVAATNEGLVHTASGSGVISWIDRGPLGNSNAYAAFDAVRRDDLCRAGRTGVRVRCRGAASLDVSLVPRQRYSIALRGLVVARGQRLRVRAGRASVRSSAPRSRPHARADPPSRLAAGASARRRSAGSSTLRARARRASPSACVRSACWRGRSCMRRS